jgi:hypothetical protein
MEDTLGPVIARYFQKEYTEAVSSRYSHGGYIGATVGVAR